VIVLCGQEIKQQLPTLHCTVIGLTRERFVLKEHSSCILSQGGQWRS